MAVRVTLSSCTLYHREELVSSLLIWDHGVDFGCTVSQISLYTAEWYCSFHLLFHCFGLRFNLSKLALLCHKSLLSAILNSANPIKEMFECVGNFFREFLQTYKEDVLVCSRRKNTCRALCNNNNDSVSRWWRSCDVRTAGSGSVLRSVMSPWPKELLQLLVHALKQVTHNGSDPSPSSIILLQPTPGGPAPHQSLSWLSSPACLDCWPLQAWFHHPEENRAATDVFLESTPSDLNLLFTFLVLLLLFFCFRNDLRVTKLVLRDTGIHPATLTCV